MAPAVIGLDCQSFLSPVIGRLGVSSAGLSPIAVVDASLLHKCTLCAENRADQGAFIEAKPYAALQEQRELLLASFNWCGSWQPEVTEVLKNRLILAAKS